MKIVILTQHHENYGAHTWDGIGQCPDNWKAKGGGTYVFEGVGKETARNPKDLFFNLFPMIETSTESFREAVIDWYVAGDDEINWGEWERPIFIELTRSLKFRARQDLFTGEGFGTWTMLEDRGRADYEKVLT